MRRSDRRNQREQEKEVGGWGGGQVSVSGAALMLDLSDVCLCDISLASQEYRSLHSYKRKMDFELEIVEQISVQLEDLLLISWPMGYLNQSPWVAIQHTQH